MAYTGVFGWPLNRLMPKWLDTISPSLLDSTRYSATYSAGSIPFGKKQRPKRGRKLL